MVELEGKCVECGKHITPFKDGVCKNCGAEVCWSCWLAEDHECPKCHDFDAAKEG